MFDATISIGSVQIPVFVIVLFGGAWLISIVMGVMSHSRKKKMLSENESSARIIGKGLTFQTVDGLPAETFYHGQHTGILVSQGSHKLVVVGSETESSGLTGRNTTQKTTAPTPININVEPGLTYDLTFSFDEGFKIKNSKKQI